AEFYKQMQMEIGDFSNKTHIRVHEPYVTYSGTDAQAAYDTLCLSLYLVYLYERKDGNSEALPMTVLRSESFTERFDRLLKDALQNTHSARVTALENCCRYYPLTYERKNGVSLSEEEKASMGIRKAENTALSGSASHSAKANYQKILAYAESGGKGDSPEDLAEIERLLLTYLNMRDKIRDVDGEERKDFPKQTLTVCPSALDYKVAKDAKEKKLREKVDETMKAEYVAVDYSEEKEQAAAYFDTYQKAILAEKKSLSMNIILWVFTLLAMLIPYAMLQNVGGIMAPLYYAVAAGVFSGIYLLSFALHRIPLKRKITAAEGELYRLASVCEEKRRSAFSSLRKRYEKDLLEIENIRYECRRLAEINRLNLEQERKVRLHREKLEQLENTIKGILTNLGEDVYVSVRNTVPSDFNPEESASSEHNRIYRVFSLEKLDTLFREKEGEALV
ncbi:MAG: hypothetical protein MJ078_01170, partial [Clostridia bacterium]|nr:hypothetical protein [Clostridia bacterium]